MNNVFERFIEVLEDITLNSVLITNRERVVGTSKRKEYDYLNKNISNIVLKFVAILLIFMVLTLIAYNLIGKYLKGKEVK